MDRETYLNELLQRCAPVSTLSERNGAKVLRLRHRELEKDLVARSLPGSGTVYERLLTVRSPYIPEIYDVKTLDDGAVVLEEYIDGVSVADELAARLTATGKPRKS